MPSDSEEHAPAVPLVAAAEEAVKRAHEHNVGVSSAARDASITGWLEAFEAEHAGVLQRVLTGILEHPEMPAVVRDVLAPITNPHQQVQMLMGFISVGSIISGFVGAAIAPEVQAVSNVAWAANADQPLSPDVMALAVLRGHADLAHAYREAAMSGVNASRVDMLVANTGEPPGLQQLMEALRRGIIDHTTFAKGVRESRVRNEWLDTLTALRYSPVPVGEVVAAAVQGQISMAELAHRIDIAGLDPVDADLLYRTHGRPPGTGELEQLVNRGELSEAELIQAVRESDIKNKYIPALVRLRRKIPPMRSVVAAIHQGVLSPAAGVEKLMQLGYNASDAAMFAKEATNLKHAGVRALTQSQIHALYAQRLITRPAAVAMYEHLGYDAAEVGMLLALADHERHAKAQQSAVGRVHSRYIAHRLTRIEAITTLDKVGIDPAGRADLLGMWDDERAANAPALTLAELQGLAHRERIDQATFQRRTVRLGYAEADVPFLWALAWPPTHKAPEWKL